MYEFHVSFFSCLLSFQLMLFLTWTNTLYFTDSKERHSQHGGSFLLVKNMLMSANSFVYMLRISAFSLALQGRREEGSHFPLLSLREDAKLFPKKSC